VIIVRGACAVRVPRHGAARIIDTAKCNQCGICLLVGCPAIQTNGKQPVVDVTAAPAVRYVSRSAPNWPSDLYRRSRQRRINELIAKRPTC